MSEYLVDRGALREITKDAFFYNMIYLLNPSVLYELARVDFIFLRDNQLDLMVTFPVIGRMFRYKRIDIVESPVRLLFEGGLTRRFNSFMVPVSVSLDNLTNHLGEIRAGLNCIITSLYEACDQRSVFSHNDMLCIADLISGIDDHCLEREFFVFDFKIELTDDAALV